MRDDLRESDKRDCWLRKCTTVLHGGVCYDRKSTLHKSGNKMKRKKNNIRIIDYLISIIMRTACCP